MDVNNKNKQREVFVPVDAPKFSKGLIVRTIVFIVAIINSVALYFGFDLNLSVNQDVIYEGLSLVLGLGAMIAGYWKNNDVTPKARKKKEVAKQVDKDV